MAEEKDPTYDRVIEAWVVTGEAPGPAGVARWQARGILWVVDCIDPTRLVRCEVDPFADGVEREAQLEVVLGLLGPRAAALVGGSSRQDLPPPVAPGALPARRSAGWLAVAHDELRGRPDAGLGEPGDTLIAADMVLLSRRVGIEAELAPKLSMDDVADALDDLDDWLVPLLAEEEPAAARLLEPTRAMVRAEELPVVGVDPLSPADLAGELLPGRSGRTVYAEMAASDLDEAVLCQGLPAGAVVGVSAALDRTGAHVEVVVRLGDRPAEALHLHAVRLEDNRARAREPAPFLPAGPLGTLRASVPWVASGANALVVSESPAGPAGWIDYSSEAVHWGREAVRAARRSEGDLAVALWKTCADWWRFTGLVTLAREAERQATKPLPPSPFLRERQAARSGLRRALGQMGTAGSGPGWPDAGHRAPHVADLLGYVDLAAEARMEVAVAAFRAGHYLAAMVNAARCRRDFARCGNGGAARQAAELHQEAEGRWG